jgi:transcriptional regulator with XRE-family HTH domain
MRKSRKRKPSKSQPGIVQAFARRLRDARAERGLSQMKLSAKSGVSMGYLGRLERAEVEPGLGVIERLSAALGVPPADLLGGVARGPESLDGLRDQARENVEAAIRIADRPALMMFCSMGSLAANALARNR